MTEGSRDILGMLYDVAGIGMCVTDEERRFVVVNRAYCETYGYSSEELIGNEFTMVLPEEHRTDGAALHDDFLLRERGEVAGGWEVVRKDGAIRSVLVTAGRLELPGKRLYKVTTVYDITNRQTHGSPTDGAERRLLLKETHHRVKNHLSSLEGMLNLELLHSRDDERAAQILADSINRIKTMSRLYDRLQGAPDVTTVDMQSYVRALATDVGRSQRESRAVHLDVEVDPLHVVVDQAISIGLIVNELVTNSLKHAIPAGRSGTIHIRVHGRSGYIELRVSDSGPGVDADYLERRRDSLGIQIVTAIVERHGGEFTLEDPEHSAFLVRLPRRLTSS